MRVAQRNATATVKEIISFDDYGKLKDLTCYGWMAEVVIGVIDQTSPHISC